MLQEVSHLLVGRSSSSSDLHHFKVLKDTPPRSSPATYLSSSAHLAGSPHPHSFPPPIHPTLFLGSPYYHFHLLSPAPSCPSWGAAYGQAEACGTVATGGKDTFGRWEGYEGRPYIYPSILRPSFHTTTRHDHTSHKGGTTDFSSYPKLWDGKDVGLSVLPLP